MGPGALMPDDLRYGVLWMGRETLQAAYDLEGAFNEVSASLLRGADPERVVDEMDRLLDRYGSHGAYVRADQASNWFLSNEIDQLATMARFLPTVFLAVAAFLTNMVVARLVAVERPEIGLLKAFGYANTAIAWHYVKLVLAIGAVGTLLGWFIGYWLAYTARRCTPNSIGSHSCCSGRARVRSCSQPGPASVPRCSARSGPCVEPRRCRPPPQCSRPPRPCSGTAGCSCRGSSGGSTNPRASCCARPRAGPCVRSSPAWVSRCRLPC